MAYNPGPLVNGSAFLENTPMNHMLGGRLQKGTGQLRTFQEMFGAPEASDHFDETDPRKINAITFPDVYSRQSQDMGTTIAMTSMLAPNDITSRLAPLTRTESMHITWNTLETLPMIAERVAHRGVARLFQQKSGGGSSTLSRYLLNHMCEAEVARTEYGELYIRRIFLQVRPTECDGIWWGSSVRWLTLPA